MNLELNFPNGCCDCGKEPLGFKGFVIPWDENGRCKNGGFVQCGLPLDDELTFRIDPSSGRDVFTGPCLWGELPPGGLCDNGY